MKAQNLPADLIKDWARKHAAANAKLEGRELPNDYVRPLHIEEWLGRRQKPVYSMQEAPLSERLEMEALWG